jgi:predicted metal-dependent peptidase
VFKDFVTTHNKDAQMAHWKRHNKKLLGAGVYMPSYYGETSGHIAKYDDTSGSISEKARQRSLGALLEIADIIKPTGLHISYWDTKIRGTEAYTPDEYDTIADMTKPIGGGGTDVDCVVHDVNDKLNTGVYSEGLECAIIITDGWFFGDLDDSWSALDIPVLWCIDNFEGYANVDFEPPCGTKLIMKEQ